MSRQISRHKTAPVEDDPRTMPARRVLRRVLVANRGEIALRVIRTCRAMGIATVAVFSDADARAPHVLEADEAVRIGGSMPGESYLNVPAIIDAALRTGADAIHPGYGFLAENADFATACGNAGLVFIGPRPDAISRMGSKREARLLVAAHGVPVVPGYEGEDQSNERFVLAAREIGYPVLVKASAGGGGKGMRTVWQESDLVAALEGARREARSAFGDETLLLERLVQEPRHIEFQIFGDQWGNIIHLGERECTIQRRHQKVIEETPSVALTSDLRQRMGEAAVTVGRLLSYTGAGTVEFILDSSGEFAFLEVNTRLQVEHPVTELVTGLDLVRWQILVAEGQPLPLRQEDIHVNGHAIEARVYAEDPQNGFLPSTGRLIEWREPAGDGVRVDGGVCAGDVVAPFYDPMLAKICAWGEDRIEAIRRLEYALGQAVVFGVRNNLHFLRRILLHDVFVAGAISTTFIERYASALLDPPGDAENTVTLAALVVALVRFHATGQKTRWRNNLSAPMIERYSEQRHADAHSVSVASIEVRLWPERGQRFSAVLVHGEERRSVNVLVREARDGDLVLEIDGRVSTALARRASTHDWWVRIGGSTHILRWHSPLPEPEDRERASGSLVAPMPGVVVSVLVEEGQEIHADDPLLILEAMKMEHTVRAPYDGFVEAIRYHVGEQVAASAVLLDVRSVEEDA